MVTQETEPDPEQPRASRRARIRGWITTRYGDADAEARAIEERHQRLLDGLAREVAEAPDDVPIKDLIERLNRHRGD